MKNNKLIAEFMEFPTQSDAVDGGTLAYYVGESIMHTDNTENENENDVFHPDDMLFNTSWDWLMPVVIKIGDNANILGAMKKLRTYSKVRNLEDTYQSVVEFIKNQNNESTKRELGI